jgi:putative ABC transport system permease protein
MTFLDLITLILENLSRRKARVALTAIGVVIGTSAIVVLVSLAIGLQIGATERFGSFGDLTAINVMPNFGEGGPGPVVVDVGPGGGSGGPPIQTLITDQSLEELAAIPGVLEVIPRDYLQGEGILNFNRLETWAGITGVGVHDLGLLDMEAQSGTLLLERGTLVIGSQIPLNFYDPRTRPGQEPPPPPELLDQQVKLVLRKYDNEGNEVKKTVQVRVVGILAETGRDDWSLYMPIEDVTAYNEWFRGSRINRNREGYMEIIVKVEDVDEVLDIAELIKGMGYQAYTSLEFVQGINSFYVILQVIFGGVGAVTLLVAAIGIANTMTMAILERTREIGLMKALGATNRDVLTVFLGEAAGIGFLGGLGGVILGWSAGQLLNVLAIVYLAQQSAETGAPPPSTAVFTPLWLPISSLIFATIIGLLSGLYPALRAANLVPVNALKYE